MGKANKERRAARAKSRARSRHRGDGGSSAPGASQGTHAHDGAGRQAPGGAPLFTETEAAHHLLVFCAQAHRQGDPLAAGGIERLITLPSTIVDREVEGGLLSMVGETWVGGWQPAELLRQGKLGCSTAAAGRLVALAIATDNVGRRATTLDSRWRSQLDGLGLPAVDGRPGWVRRWAADEGLDRPRALAAAVDALANIGFLPTLDEILPPPGSAEARSRHDRIAGSSGARGAVSNPLLDRIRNLLAKAESTTFEAEASALTAKAQELMTRHAIDAALVHGRSTPGDAGPTPIRIPIDAPYVDAKSLLLQTVAEAGRCRTALHPRLGLSSVVGFPDDLAAVELLFTSLLVQAQTALAAEAARAPTGTRTRQQSFRSAFLLAYTQRIGARLREINQAVFNEVEAEQGPAFLPVLRARSATVDDFIAERFGEMVTSAVRGGYDSAGWASGRVAADNAKLSFGDLVEDGERAD